MSGDLLRLGAVFGLILLNGLFVAAEFAIVTARPTRIEQMVAAGNRRARIVQRSMADPNRFISASQVGITMASLALGWIAEPALSGIVRPLLEPILGENAWIGAHVVAGILAYFIITLLHIVLGEQVPKMIALQRAEATALTTAVPVAWMSIPFRPFIALLYWLTGVVLRPLGLEQQSEHGLVYSSDELKMLVSDSQRRGLIDTSEHELINRVFGFADLTAEEAMVPRTEMTVIPIDATLQEVTKTVASSGHARFPVYGENADDILGIFYAKDLYKLLARGQTDRFQLRRMIRPPLTIPSAMQLDDLLARMKRDRTQIAMVVDEYGGTAGMVTLEDVVERIIGDVDDEFERPSQDIQPLPNGESRVSGLMPIAEANERLNLTLEDPFYLTVGGYVFGQLGRRPELGDEITAGGATLRVDALDRLRIDKVRVIPLERPNAQQEAAGISAEQR